MSLRWQKTQSSVNGGWFKVVLVRGNQEIKHSVRQECDKQPVSRLLRCVGGDMRYFRDDLCRNVIPGSSLFRIRDAEGLADDRSPEMLSHSHSI